MISTGAHVDPITLSVTDTNSHIETYTYDFQLPRGDVYGLGRRRQRHLPPSPSPDTISPSDPAWASDGLQRRFQLGVLDTWIPLPSYNPNVPALDLTYDSSTQPDADHPGRKHLQLLWPSRPRSAHLDIQQHGRNNILLQHEQPQPGDVQQIAVHMGHPRWRPAGTATRCRSSTRNHNTTMTSAARPQ